LFVEPEGFNTNEVYLNGLSTSLPAQLQQEIVNLIPGMDDAQIIRPGYAIEYDFVDPRELTPFLETARIKGLFLAGQINGTTGYEEAGCQGLIAGINAGLLATGREPFRIHREESYIGVLIDDLITQGVDEPYRMFTSRSEHRLSLRHDNADERLGPKGRELGLIGDSEWERFSQRRDRLAKVRRLLASKKIRRTDPAFAHLREVTGQELGDSINLGQLALRPNITVSEITKLLAEDEKLHLQPRDFETALADCLYAGYLESQDQTSRRLRQHDALAIPETLAFNAVGSLSHEMVERLERVKPRNFGDARKIPGLTPAALSNLLVYLTAQQTRPLNS
jgi:tRNA uridine 5-carboxymethylaminomethyl modification enzyme